MTYGERWLHWKLKVSSKDTKFSFAEKAPVLGQRMSRRDASKYYSEKCRSIFKGLGYEYEDSLREFEIRFKKCFVEIRKQTNVMLKAETKKLKLALKENNDSICM